MAESVHGHEVLALIMESREKFTREDLIRVLEQKYGAEQRFHTCSASSLTAEGLLEFLEQRGKFLDTPDTSLEVDVSTICDD